MSKYKIGDVLRIRQWDDMAAEYGEYRGDIQCEGVFTSGMKYMCGEVFTVAEIYGGSYLSEEGFDRGWNITEDMLEPFVLHHDEPDLEIDKLSESRFHKFISVFQVS